LGETDCLYDLIPFMFVSIVHVNCVMNQLLQHFGLDIINISVFFLQTIEMPLRSLINLLEHAYLFSIANMEENPACQLTGRFTTAGTLDVLACFKRE
jgi:hypothetical protein